MFSKAKRFNYNETHPQCSLSYCELFAKRCQSFVNSSPSESEASVKNDEVAFSTSTRKSRRDCFQIAKLQMERGSVCERFLRRHSTVQTSPTKDSRISRGSWSTERASLSPRPSRVLQRSVVSTPQSQSARCCRRSTSTNSTKTTVNNILKEGKLVKSDTISRSKSCDLPRKPQRKTLISKIPVSISNSPSTTSIKSKIGEIRTKSPQNVDDEIMFYPIPSEESILLEKSGEEASFIPKRYPRKFRGRQFSNQTSSEESMESDLESKIVNFHRRIQQIQLSSSDEGINISPFSTSCADFDRIIQNLDNKISSLITSQDSTSNIQRQSQPEPNHARNDHGVKISKNLEKDQALEVNLRVLLEHDVKNHVHHHRQEDGAPKHNREEIYLQVMEQLCKKLGDVEAENRKLKAEKSDTFRKFYRFLKRSKK